MAQVTERRRTELRDTEQRDTEQRDTEQRDTERRLARTGLLLVGMLLLVMSACSLPRWPVEGTMTSPYGLRMRGLRPALHHGIDIAAPTGTPVRAMKAGRVERAGPLGSYGLTVVMSHGSNVRTLYAHLSRIDVSAGQQVSGGHVIGAIGSTGNATGPHLHFEITRWGRAEDPVVLLGGMP